jgi:hypothetical protein
MLLNKTIAQILRDRIEIPRKALLIDIYHFLRKHLDEWVLLPDSLSILSLDSKEIFKGDLVKYDILHDVSTGHFRMLLNPVCSVENHIYIRCYRF